MLHSRCSAARRPMDNVAFYVVTRELSKTGRRCRAARQWRNNGVGRMGKVQGAPSAGAPEFQAKKFKIIFPL